MVIMMMMCVMCVEDVDVVVVFYVISWCSVYWGIFIDDYFDYEVDVECWDVWWVWL